jgi:hypothetical protein
MPGANVLRVGNSFFKNRRPVGFLSSLHFKCSGQTCNLTYMLIVCKYNDRISHLFETIKSGEPKEEKIGEIRETCKYGRIFKE